ncbi:hypothetical protein STEG23_024177, partial [Scotinomys teguina]
FLQKSVLALESYDCVKNQIRAFQCRDLAAAYDYVIHKFPHDTSLAANLKRSVFVKPYKR